MWEDRKTQVDSLDQAKLGTAQLVHEISMPGSSQKVVKVTGVLRKNASVTILVRGSNKLVLEEADRSLHDALCVVRSLVKKRYLISGGGSAEVEACLKLSDIAKTKPGSVRQKPTEPGFVLPKAERYSQNKARFRWFLP